jgi:melibiose permease/lactose/raffinose/galactose permease
MVPALSSDANSRNQFTSRATLFAGIGNVLASVLIPLLTTGEYALGGSAKVAYGRIALVICILAPLFICFTLFGVRENRDDNNTPAPPVSMKKILTTILGNDQLLWISLIFLIQQVGNGIVLGGAGSNYIYFEFGYEGGLYSIFTTVGMAATAFLMVFYPAISRHIQRKTQVRIMGISATVGYVIQLASGLLLPSSNTKFWILTAGFVLANFGQYGLYLIMMISIINTVEYNEYQHGTRDEAIITSMRPFLTKLGSAIVVMITSGTYMLFQVTRYTNQISSLESAAEIGTITTEQRSASIAEVIATVTSQQTTGLLLAMTVLPCILMLISCVLYQKFYKLDEERYDEICAELAQKKAKEKN